MLLVNLSSDRALVKKSLRGDKHAFGRLFDRHAAKVYQMLRRLTANDDMAEDLAQETFIAAFQTLDAWRGEAAFSTWLCGIAVRRYAALRRQRFRQPPVAPLDDDDENDAFMPNDDPLAHYKRREAEAALAIAVASLSDTCREVFVLVRIEEMPYRTVADLLDIPLGTVQSRLNRATKALHQRLAPLIYDGEPVSLPDTNKGANHDVR